MKKAPTPARAAPKAAAPKPVTADDRPSACDKMKFGKLSAAVIVPLALAIGICVALLVAVSLPVSSQQTLDKAAVEQIVADYIAANGDKIKESLIAAERRAQQATVADLITDQTPTRGPADAPVTIIEFGDFECPFCARVQPTLQNLEKAYEGKVRFAFKQLPLPFHRNAKPAAYAALAAHQQGKYWEYTERLWANPAQLGDAMYVQIAQELGLNLNKFNRDRASAAIQQQVEADLADATKAGARGTPFFFINGEPLSGALPEAEFRAVIDAALKAAQ
ncbi:MAG: thioredoxin domain-containing protein [Alphaproteobacteria bacterium]|jgi:protein-disulfide isomerase|nr:thioredoxin domain-containing protein [Alphaproteobacteria bacterium]